MSYFLTIHPEADADAEQIAAYIGERSFDGMIRWLDAYEAVQTRITTNPLLCSPASEEPILNRGLRQALFKTPAGDRHRAVFIVDGDQITILRVCGKGQELLADKELPSG